MARVKAEKVLSNPLPPSVQRSDIAVPAESLSYEVRRRLEVVQRLEHSSAKGSQCSAEQEQVGCRARYQRP